ncbi:MAG: hypothetical protein MMC33_004654 [Icmadophila ericetorum]|nr:hypothetical protein [Icmadophila ericetorum]
MERPQALPVMANAPPDGHFAAVGVDVVTPNWENPALYVLETRPNVGMDVVDRSSDDESMAGGSIAGDPSDEDGGFALSRIANNLRTLQGARPKGQRKLPKPERQLAHQMFLDLNSATKSLKRIKLSPNSKKHEESKAALDPLKIAHDKAIAKKGKKLSNREKREKRTASNPSLHAQLLKEAELERNRQARVKKMQEDHPTLNEKQARRLIKMEDDEQKKAKKAAARQGMKHRTQIGGGDAGKQGGIEVSDKMWVCDDNETQGDRKLKFRQEEEKLVAEAEKAPGRLTIEKLEKKAQNILLLPSSRPKSPGIDSRPDIISGSADIPVA